MTKIIVNTIESQVGVTSVTFHKAITANGKNQWLDRFGIIKANSTEINENVTIASGTNGLSVGTIRIGAGHSVTVQGNWRIV
tara:strand:+ start:1010 stop:1255 length:246 start_codon:yes stop_codon:yes gene_type:complete